MKEDLPPPIPLFKDAQQLARQLPPKTPFFRPLPSHSPRRYVNRSLFFDRGIFYPPLRRRNFAFSSHTPKESLFFPDVGCLPSPTAAFAHSRIPRERSLKPYPSYDSGCFEPFKANLLPMRSATVGCPTFIGVSDSFIRLYRRDDRPGNPLVYGSDRLFFSPSPFRFCWSALFSLSPLYTGWEFKLRSLRNPAFFPSFPFPSYTN